MLGSKLPLQILQVSMYCGCSLITNIAILFEGSAHDVFKLCRDLPVELACGNRHPVEDGIMQRWCGVARESSLPGCHLIKHQAEGKQVGPLIQSLSSHLFGRHVRGGPD